MVHATGAAVIRSTWDYHHRPNEWRHWLARTEERIPLLNSAALVRWNMDKSYLKRLADQGVPTVDTIFHEAGSLDRVASEARDREWKRLVVKPSIGASASGVMTAELADRRWRDHADQLLAAGAVLIQPYLNAVENDGERSLVFIGGAPAHAFRKAAFNVNAEGTARLLPHEPSASELEVADAALGSLEERPLYARVDLVPGPSGPLLMELELIEPDLGLRLRPASADLLARNCLAVL
jgi:glutathione synthase/RimK-type ligase-like ATP-grasp enzyme